jgi:hypothetical protein
MLGTSFINKLLTPELQMFAEVEVPIIKLDLDKEGLELTKILK